MSKQGQIFETGGCLSLGALVFIDALPEGFPEGLDEGLDTDRLGDLAADTGPEFGSDQQAAVKRHLRSCLSCAQQATRLSVAADKLRSRRPRIPQSSEARAIARQSALRELVMTRIQRLAGDARTKVAAMDRVTKRRKRLNLILSMVIGLLTALLALLAMLMFD